MTISPPATNPPAGMYPDPNKPGAMRFWDGAKWESAQPSAPAGRKSVMQYKVITQKDRYFGGKFNPESVEQVLNSFAQEGWHVKAITSASFQTVFSGNREEMVVVLEREVVQ